MHLELVVAPEEAPELAARVAGIGVARSVAASAGAGAW